MSQAAATPPARRPDLREIVMSIVAPEQGAWASILVVLLAFLVALVVSAVFVVFSDTAVFKAPDLGTALGTAWSDVISAYGALLAGSIGDLGTFTSAIASGNGVTIAHAFYPLSETAVAAAPLVFSGLSVALGFRAGLFNIGTEGQVIAGGLVAGWLGFTIHGLPAAIHLTLALVGGFVAGAAWGFVPGLLKARTGAHEVITTIMLNYVGMYLTYYLLSTTWFQRPGRTDPISRLVDPAAQLPSLNSLGLRAHAGVILAVLVAIAVYYLLWRTLAGFEFRAAGSNPDAARAAGISVNRVVILAMSLAGGLAGLAGTDVILGVNYSVSPGFSSGLGFDGITVALLGRGNPAGVVFAALLFGALRAGSVQMQAATATPVELVQVVESLVIMFVAAPALIRAIFRLRAARAELAAPGVSPGWGA